MAAYDLGLAIDILCGERKHPYAPIFLNFAKQVADRAYGETDRWLPSGDWGNPDGMAGMIRVLRAKAFVDALLTDSEPDSVLLLEAAMAISEECRRARGPKWWTEPEQSLLLSAVQLFLIAGDVASAGEIFKWRKSYRATQRYHDWLKELTFAIPAGGGGLDAAIQRHFDGFFDAVRDPDWISPRGRDSGYNIMGDRSLLRLQLALIKQRYILRASVQGHWDDVIDLIAR